MKNMTLNPEAKVKDFLAYGVSARQYALLFAEEFTVSNGKHGDTYWVHMNDDLVSDIVLPKRLFRTKEGPLPKSPDEIRITVNGKTYLEKKGFLKKCEIGHSSREGVDEDRITITLEDRRKNNA